MHAVPWSFWVRARLYRAESATFNNNSLFSFFFTFVFFLFSLLKKIVFFSLFFPLIFSFLSFFLSKKEKGDHPTYKGGGGPPNQEGRGKTASDRPT